MTSNIFN